MGLRVRFFFFWPWGGFWGLGGLGDFGDLGG